MTHPLRHKIGSLVSLWAILINLLPPFIPLAQANTESFSPSTPAEVQPAPVLINSHTPLTPAATSIDSILPGWFKSSPASKVDLSQTAGLTLAQPAALAALPESSIPETTVEIDQPVTVVLPGWFNPASTGNNRPSLVAQPSANSILPDWFNSDALTPQAPSSDFQSLAVPPARPSLAPIPGLLVTVLAPASVSAGNFAGDTYTVTVRNTSALTGFNFSLNANIPATGFNYVVGSAQWTSAISGVITYTDSYTDPLVVWTPNITRNLTPGEVVTLTFRLTTDGAAVSGQRLDVNAVYQNPLNSAGSTNGGVNITVGRGNLIITKSPTIQNGTFGDVITWTIEVANTGLGNIYSATVADIFGSGYTSTNGGQLAITPFTMTVGERRNFVVTATVNSCNNLTNTGQAFWSIGNDEGDGTVANPVSDTTDVAYLLGVPSISLSSNNINFDYCAQTPQTVVVTITNAPGAGAARNFRLSSPQLTGLPFTVGSLAPGWIYDGAGIFTSTNAILPGQTEVFSFVVTPTATVCGNETSGTIAFTSRFQDACNLAFVGPSTGVAYSYGAASASPNLSLTKGATVSGSNIIFDLNFLAQNVQSLSGTIGITDVVPTGLTINSFSSGGLGAITQTGNTLLWAVSPGVGPGNLTGTLRITTTRVGDPDNCNIFTNVATGTVEVTCQACQAPLMASASAVANANPLTPTIAITATGIQFDHCLIAPQTVVVTVTNSGTGPARNFGLDFSETTPGDLPDEQPFPGSVSAYGITVTAGLPSSGWTFLTPTQRFSYTANGGVISPGQTITFSFVVTPNSAVCGNAGQWEGELLAQYTDACTAPLAGPSTLITSTYVETDVPRFGLEKSSTANNPAQVGDIFDYVIDFTARNAQNMSDTIRITDVVPPAFAILAYTGTITAETETLSNTLYSLTGTTVTPAGLVSSTLVTSAVASATQLVWSAPVSNPFATPYTLTGRLTITVQALDLSATCGAYSRYTNQADGSVGDACQTCDPLEANASADVAIEAPTGPPAASGPKVATLDGQVCGLITVTNTYSRVFISDWNQATFTETLGTDAGLSAGALSYVSGTLTVMIDNTDVTTQVTIVQTTPQLVLDFNNVTLVPIGTHNITVAYRLFISDTILSGNASVNPNIRSIFEVTNVGSSGPCGSGDNYLFDTVAPLTIQRADLQITLATGSAVTCAPISVTLTVADPNLVSNSLVANNVVVTFSVPSTAQLETIAGITYGGALAGNPVTVVTGTNVITWIFQNPFSLTTGTISFSMTGSCGSSTLNAGVRFSDRCDVTYGDSASSSLNPLPPDVSLFVTPDQFTVNENRANWRIYATNGGAGTAGRLVITDVLGFGLQYASFTTNYTGQVNLLTTGPFTPGQDIVWEILNLASGQQVRIDVNADVVGCGGLTSDISMDTGCLGDGTCGTVASDSLNFLQPPFAVRSSNAQTADLPFCGNGEVILNVKNSSASAHIYQMVITESLTSLSYVAGTTRMTVTNRAGQIVDGLADIPFEPVTVISGSNIVLLWRLTDPGVTLSQTQILTDRAPEDTVTVRFVAQTECSTPGFNRVQSSAGGLQSCGTFFFRDESAVTLDTIEPDISLAKEGLNVTKGDITYTTNVIGEPGDVIVWRVRAVNATSANIAQNVVVTDTLPSNMNQAVPTASSASGTITTTPGLVTWNIGSLPADGVDRTLYITTTIDAEPTACQSTFTNTALLVYGCDSGCLADSITATANLRSQPLITAQVLNTASLNTCGGLITVTLTNNSLPIYYVTLTDTLPSGYVYDSMVFSSTAPSILPTDGVTTAVWAWTGGISLPTGVTTLTFQVRNNSSTGTCAPTSAAPNVVDISYDDNPACTASGPYTATGSSTINIVAPTLDVDKSPVTRVADAGQVVTWTVTVQNTGTGDAVGVSVTDTVGSGFSGIIASNGSDANETNTPTLVGSVITWTPAVTIAPGDTWQAVVTATLAADGTGIPTNTVEASGDCTSGCNYVSGITDTAFVTLLTNFDKAPSVQTGTIGSLAVFTFTTSLPDFDAFYQNLTITDALPSGLGYVASVVTYTVDGDGSTGGPTASISTTPTLAPAFAQNGNVVWNLSDLPGAVLINGVITTVIQDIAGNQGGVNRTNSLSMTYLDNGQSYNFTDTAQVNIAEPIMHLSKSYVTSSGCNATLLVDNFNDNNDTGWTQVGGAGWSVAGGVYQNNSNAANRLSFNGSLAWTDYSFSTMVRSTDDDEIGLLFRAQSNNTSFYRFQWRQQSGATMGQRLERVNSAGVTTTLASNVTPYVSGQWYHVEIRAEGSRLRVYVDEQLIFDVTDTAFAAGQIGLYANNENAAFFDDVLVTRLGQQGCLVGANDLVTYTLVVSNQGQLPGYDLVITDAIPAGMSLLNASLQSDDPASAFTAAPTPPVSGAANLIWNINQLTSTLPFNPLAHPALTITVVLSVSDGITANTALSNQAFLSYDSWLGSTNPTTVTRNYSGGSHSTAIRTIDGGLAKTVTFDPPPTATLGSLVTYTLIVPASPITATLYNVVMTDQLNTPRFFIESVTTGGGTGGSASFNQASGAITATFASVPHDTQAFVTVTTRISDSFPSPATDIPSGPGPDVVTNSAVLTHASSTAITTSNVVTTNVGEPQIIAGKTAAVLGANQQTAVYTITALNIGNSPAYSFVITDNLPAGIIVTTISDGGQVSPDGRTLTWAMPVSTALLPGGSLALTYTVQLSQPIYNTNLFTNTAIVRNTSLTDTIPGTRPFTSTTVNTFTWPLVSLGNFVWFDTNNNGLTDTGEVGVPGVAVELYQDSNGDGQYTPGVDGLISTTATVAGGFYSFTNLLPSLSPNQAYLVVITSTNFNSGGVLSGYFNSDGSVGGNSDLNSQDHGLVTGTLGSGGFVASTPVSLTVGTEPTNDGDADASSNLTIDFGFYRLSLGDRVWFDTNNNALLDGGETGASSVTVRLYDSTGTTVLSTTTTDASGFYTFTNLFSGTYIVEIVPPATFTSSTNITSSINPDNNVNSDDNGVNLTPTGTIRSNPVVLTPGSSGAQNQNTVTHATGSTHNPTVDFGLVQMVALGNIVWIDDGAGSGGVANNGRLDGSEIGVNGVEVQVYRQGQTPGVDTPVLTTTTAGGGFYQFDNLTPGQYFVHIPASEFGAGQPLVGYVSSSGAGSDETTDHIGDENGIDSFTPIITGISSQVYNLQPDTEITGEGQSNYTGILDNDNVNFTADFGFVQAVAIGNIVWIDNGAGSGGVANNGRLDGGEAGVDGVEVQLYRQGQTPGVNTPVLTTTTSGGGFYQFDNLVPGQYFVHIPASEFGAGQPLVGYVSSTGAGSDETTDHIGDENGIDSFTPITTGISSQVYNLQPDTEVTGEGQSNYTGTLDDNNVNFTADFGFVQAVAIGNIVWIDNGVGSGGVANNGRLDGTEAGVNGVEVQLYRQGQTPGVNTPILTTTTSGGGFYQFDNLTPGQYFIHIPASEFGVGQPLNGFLSSTGAGSDETTDHTGDENGIDNLAPASTGINSQVYNLQPDTEVTGEGQTNYTGILDDNNVNFTADFGFVSSELVAIGNIVWIDNGSGGGTANNGRLDGSEAGVNGVEVQLYRQGQTPGVDTPVLTTTTSGGGFYQFDNLTPGQYFVHIPASKFGAGQPLAGYVSSSGAGNDEITDQTGDENGIDSFTPITTGISSQVYNLQPNTEVTGEGQSNYTGTLDDNNVNFTADFGFVQAVAIGNIVWIDNGVGSGGVANNGRLDGAEAGVNGVEVQVYRQGQTPGVDTPVLTTTTAGGGFYQFDNLTPGQYFIHIPASEFAAGQPLSGYLSSTGNGADETTDHTGDENGVDNLVPASTGISSQVYNLQPDTEITGEGQTNYTGTLDDNNVNFTADFGFVSSELVAIGNIVWFDNGSGGGTANNGRLDGTEAGVDGVEVQLYRQGQTPGVNTPVLTTTTSGGGFYQFDNLTPGQYFVHIPASEFGAGQPLVGYVSSTGAGNDETTDHTGDENGIDSFTPITTGISSQVYNLQPNSEASGEGQSNYTGILDDDNVNFTADFGFVQLVAIGNIVWIDDGTGGGAANNGRLDGAEAGINGVQVQLYRQGQTPGVDTPVLITTTAGGGFYQFDNLIPGQYFVHIPAFQFALGQPLHGYVSSTGAGNDETTDQTGDENGIDSPTPASTGISSQVYNLQPNSEVSGEGQSNYSGSLDDDNVNFTADFGFYPQPVLHLDKRVSPTGTISPGQRLDYTLCFSNSGKLTATNVVITDFVPFNTTFVPGSVTVPAPVVVEYQDNGNAFVGTEPITTTGLRWSLTNLAPAVNICVGFSVQVNLTISDTTSGLAVMASPLGWIVLEGDTSGMPIITRTILVSPTVTPTPTLVPTETPLVTPTVTVTPEMTATPTPAPTPDITLTPVVTETATTTPPATAEATPALLPTGTPTAAPVTETPVLTSTETLPPTETPTEQSPAGTVEPTATATEAPVPTEPPTDTPTPVPPAPEPTPLGEAIIPGWFLASISMIAAPGLFGQLTYQSQITATGTTEPTTQPEMGVESTIAPVATAEPTDQAATDTPAPTTPPDGSVTPIATLTGTIEATPAVSPTSEPTTAPGTTEPTETVAPTETVLPTPEITATVSNPVASGEYVIVPFDTVLINIPNVAIISSDQTPTQTDVVTTPLIRVIDPLLTKEVNPTQASPGDLVNFTITVQNPAPPSNANATNLVVVDPLPYNVDLVNFSASSAPSGLVSNIEVITTIVPIVGHPLGITQATATTLTMFIPVLGPNQRVVLNLTTRVNNLASPPPQTIRNVALLTFNEGDDVPPARVSVDVPIPNDRHNDNDNNDDDNNVPTPSAPTPTVPPSLIQVQPTLPALFLPETGFRESQSNIRGVWLLLPLLSIMVLIGVASVVKRKR